MPTLRRYDNATELVWFSRDEGTEQAAAHITTLVKYNAAKPTQTKYDVAKTVVAWLQSLGLAKAMAGDKMQQRKTALLWRGSHYIEVDAAIARRNAKRRHEAMLRRRRTHILLWVMQGLNLDATAAKAWAETTIVPSTHISLAECLRRGRFTHALAFLRKTLPMPQEAIPRPPKG